MRPSISKNDARNYTLGEPVRKTVTFLNSTGVIDLFSVTGIVVARIVPVCKTLVASAAAANIRLGVTSNTNSMIVDTVASALLADYIWVDASPTDKIEPLSAMREYIISGTGNNVILTLSAQVDSGVIEFDCFWQPSSLDGNLVAA